MKVVAVLRGLEALAEALHKRPSLPLMSACEKQAAAMVGHDHAAPLPSDDILDALRDELRAICTSDGPRALPMRTLRRAPLVFWDRDPQAAALPGLIDAFFEAAEHRRSFLRGVIEAWVRDFGVERPHLERSGALIAALLSGAADPRLQAWQNAQRDFALFDARRGPATVAGALLTGPQVIEDLLPRIGMDDSLRAEGRYFRAVIVELVRMLPEALLKPNAGETWARAAQLLEIQHEGRDRTGRVVNRSRLRFPDLAGEVIGAALSPWLRSGTPPPAAPRDAVRGFLLRVVGDPRLNPTRWQDAHESCARMVRGWLANASLETFFRLISQTNDDAQWRYRLAFWRACLRNMPRNQPGEVWVVLSPGIAARAKVVEDLQNGFGVMDGVGQYADQAVLLIRLGDIVLSEWSNVGPVRAWQVGDRRCPPLYRTTRYSVGALRAPCMYFPDSPVYGRGGAAEGRGLWHRGADKGFWQGYAAAFLKDHTALRLTRKDYMPQ